MQSAPKVAIIRAQGSNGDREMMASFWMAGFDVWDVTMSDLVERRTNLNEFRGAAFVGGFSFADVTGSANGWYSTIEFTPHLKEQFDIFYNREDTFSLGICNGFQLLARLGWFGTKFEVLHNISGRFESRFVEMHISVGKNTTDNTSTWLKDMNDTRFGIWVAHGEGRINLPKEYIRQNPEQFPLLYVDSVNNVIGTEKYPCNPNGSPMGIAGMISKNGRHFGMMPHPERCVLTWQLPWCPVEMKKSSFTPWMKFFKNIHEFVEKK